MTTFDAAYNEALATALANSADAYAEEFAYREAISASMYLETARRERDEAARRERDEAARRTCDEAARRTRNVALRRATDDDETYLRDLELAIALSAADDNVRPVARSSVPSVGQTRVLMGTTITSSGANNNCMLESFRTAGVSTMTADKIREAIIEMLIENGDVVAQWVVDGDVAQLINRLLAGDQAGEEVLRVAHVLFRKTIVVFKHIEGDRYTSRVYGREYNNWSGIALIHHGDSGAMTGGHYDAFDTRTGGSKRVQIQGEMPPARMG